MRSPLGRGLIQTAGLITPFSTLLYARMGNGIATQQLMKMVAGAVNPGKPVANLYVSGSFAVCSMKCLQERS